MNLSLSVDTKTNLSLWTTIPDHYVKNVCVRIFFLVRIFFPHLDWLWRFTEQVRVFTQNVTKCGPDQRRMRILFTQLTSEHSFVILVPLYFKLTVISWQLAEWLWRHETISSNSRCFVSLIPEYNHFISIY